MHQPGLKEPYPALAAFFYSVWVSIADAFSCQTQTMHTTWVQMIFYRDSGFP